MSDFYIYNPNRERIGKLQHFDSIQWLDNAQSPGEVKIVAYVTPLNLELLVDGNRLYNTDEDTVAKICHIEIVESMESGSFERFIEARAFLTAHELDERVVMATETIRNAETAMYGIYTRNRRNSPILPGTSQGFTETLDTEVTWNSVLDGIMRIAEASGLCFTVRFNPETGAETFVVYRGTDRSSGETNDYVGYFGSDAGNVSRIELTSGTSNYKNVAIVAGEGEGAARKVRTVSLGSFQGEQRRELFVDARDLQSEVSEAVFTGQQDDKGNPIFEYRSKTYTEAEYNALLDARGLEKLAEHLKDFSLSCDIEQTNLIYREDYFLGDRMPVKLPQYGITASAIVSSVRRIYERSGPRIIATLSNFILGGG